MKSASALYKLPHAGNEIKYFDRKSNLTEEEYGERLRTSTTLYVGNLSFFTLESQLLEFFSSCGQVVNLIMGLNRMKMQPCGFCFVEYATRQEAALAVNTLNRSVLDGRIIRVDWDYGFEPHRQFGRGRTGGQVRDEVRQNQAKGQAGPGSGQPDTQMKDADRPLVQYSHAKRDYSQRPRGQHHHGNGGHYNRGNNNYDVGDGGDGGGRNSRYHSHHGGHGHHGHHHNHGGDNQRGGQYPRKRNYRDQRFNDDNGDNNYRGGGGGGGGNYYRGSTTSAEQQPYQDFDSEQMGIMSKRRRMNAYQGGGGRGNSDFMGGDDGRNSNNMGGGGSGPPFNKAMSQPPMDPMFVQKDLTGQQQQSAGAHNMQQQEF